MKINGKGSIVQLDKTVSKKKCRRWQLRVPVGKDYISNKYHTKTRRFTGTEKQAEKALSEFITELETGVRVDTKDMTFAQFSELWHKERIKSGELQRGTLRRTDYRIRSLNKYIGNVKLSDLDRKTIIDLYSELRNGGSLSGNPLSGTTLKGIAITLNQVLNEAVARDILLRNPCKTIPTPTIDTEEKEALSKDDAQLLIGLLMEDTPDAHRLAVQLGLTCGLRRGEATGLRWRDYDQEANCIRITHALSADGKELKAPKTKSGKRTIPLDVNTSKRLAEWKSIQENQLKEIGVAQTGNTHIVTSSLGGPLHPQNLTRWWERYRVKHGFDSISFHQLRHTFATLLVSNGIDIVTAKTLMGHSDTKMLTELYAHAVDENMTNATKKIGDILYSKIEKVDEDEL